MKDDILVSIIVPVYNVEKYIDECLQSLVNQTYKNIEILLIDDCSTDMSGQICDEWGKKDNRISVYHKENEGLGLTRNYGIKRAKGEYIVFQDSDDYINVDMIRVMLEEREKNDADTVIVGFHRIVNGKITYTDKYQWVAYEGDAVRRELLPRFVGSSPSGRDGLFQTACAKLYSSAVINDNNLQFVSERQYQGEDMVFQLDYFIYSEKVVVSDRVFYYYRYNDRSLTKTYKENRFDGSKKMYLYIKSKFEEYGLDKDAFLRLGKYFFLEIHGTLQGEIPRIALKTRKECIEDIRHILQDETITEVLMEYPTRKLTWKQQIFVYLLKYKQAYLLFMYMNLK